jgi:excisionase family DNA binding protein
VNKSENVVMAFCTTREAAVILGVSLRTVQLWAEAGLLDAWKTSGGHRRISRDSVERLLARRPSSPEIETAGVDESSLRILVVEDDPAVLRVCERQMARWPMKPLVVTAQNGFEALVRVGLIKPDLLVTDLHMPEMDGFQMLQQLLGMSELAELTIVVVTGLDDAEVKARGGVPEGIPVLPKPIPFDRLRDIATVMAARKQRRQLQPVS